MISSFSFCYFGKQATKLSDNDLEWPFRFLFQVLHITGVTLNCEYLCQLALTLPSALYMLRKFLNLKHDNFVKFAVSQNLQHSTSWKIVLKWLEERLYPTYAQISHSSKAEGGSVRRFWLKEVILGSGKVCFYPHKVYCFNIIIDQVEKLLKKPGVPEMSSSGTSAPWKKTF